MDNQNKKSPVRQEAHKLSRDEAIAVILDEIKADPVKTKAFIVDVLGEEWETSFCDR